MQVFSFTNNAGEILKQTFHFENFRKKAEAVKWRGHESVRRGSRDSKATPDFIASGHSNVSINTPAFKKENGRYERGQHFSDTNSAVHPRATAAWNTNQSSRSNVGEENASRSNNVPVAMGDYLSSSSQKENVVTREPTRVSGLIQQLY